MPAEYILEKEAAVKRRHARELIVMGFVSVLVLVAVLLCVWTVLRKDLASGDGKLAFFLLITITSTLLGYTAGKSAQ